MPRNTRASSVSSYSSVIAPPDVDAACAYVCAPPPPLSPDGAAATRPLVLLRLGADGSEPQLALVCSQPDAGRADVTEHLAKHPDWVQFALWRQGHALLLVQSLGEQVTGVRRARALAHARTLARDYPPFAQASATVLIRRLDELTDTLVQSSLRGKAGPAELDSSVVSTAPRPESVAASESEVPANEVPTSRFAALRAKYATLDSNVQSGNPVGHTSLAGRRPSSGDVPPPRAAAKDLSRSPTAGSGSSGAHDPRSISTAATSSQPASAAQAPAAPSTAPSTTISPSFSLPAEVKVEAPVPVNEPPNIRPRGLPTQDAPSEIPKPTLIPPSSPPSSLSRWASEPAFAPVTSPASGTPNATSPHGPAARDQLASSSFTRRSTPRSVSGVSSGQSLRADPWVVAESVSDHSAEGDEEDEILRALHGDSAARLRVLRARARLLASQRHAAAEVERGLNWCQHLKDLVDSGRAALASLRHKAQTHDQMWAQTRGERAQLDAFERSKCETADIARRRAWVSEEHERERKLEAQVAEHAVWVARVHELQAEARHRLEAQTAWERQVVQSVRDARAAAEEKARRHEKRQSRHEATKELFVQHAAPLLGLSGAGADGRTTEADALLVGFLGVQRTDSTLFRRRVYVLRPETLELYASEGRTLIQRLEVRALAGIESVEEGGMVSHALALYTHESGAEPALVGFTDSEADKDALLAALEVLTGLTARTTSPL